MQVRIKNTHDAAIKSLKTGDDIPAERIDKRNKSILRDLFRRLTSGEIDAVCPTKTTGTIYVLTRATRHNGVVKTCFWINGGEWTPVSHHEYKTIDSITEYAERLPSGLYEII